MSSSQIIIVTGHLGNDPILRYTTEGLAVVNFTVAVNMGKDKEPIWHNVSAWNHQAENCAQWLKKGSLVQVTGIVKARAFQTKQGQMGASLDVTANQVTFLNYAPAETTATTNGSDENLNDIPF